ncbi:hypothetical protein ATK17_0942 [Branchiibius hedensis]|uniref:Rv2175c C-terminal domain-containing protein n=1 Tax=Branchiibius hedensis TaxID=672460 RepID=A0A2Y8ZUV6_9MICO|nr:Rv2175c family DNA-binding protein [Branchiibius hedensis]PWJ24841.1 hypothetical protein ATK17_0942 [Branchiibius hedensis]SSA33657.1 hypothetical protein SAMN04489750_0942 [Branchiibius hedensis]
MADLETLITDWLSIPEFADALGVPQRQGRKLVDEQVVLSARVGPNQALAVPAAFVRDGQLLPGLTGTITVLRDSGLPDDEALEWLFTPDPTLPIEGGPMGMLSAGRKAEVRKRAMELAL